MISCYHAVVRGGEVLVLRRVVVDHGRRVIVVALTRALQRHGAVRARGLHGLEHLVDGRAELLRDLLDGRRALQLLRELVRHLVHLGGQLLQAPRHAHGPALVAEVALDLAHDGRRGERRELEPTRQVEPVDGLDEADRAHLHEVVEGLAPVLELGGQEAHEVEVAHDELLAGLLVPLLLVAPEQLPRAVFVPRKLALRHPGRDAPARRDLCPTLAAIGHRSRQSPSRGRARRRP